MLSKIKTLGPLKNKLLSETVDNNDVERSLFTEKYLLKLSTFVFNFLKF